jgi:hypothetical protein
LDGNILDNDITIDGFSDKIFRKDRKSFEGDVLVYTSKGICVKEIILRAFKSKTENSYSSGPAF